MPWLGGAVATLGSELSAAVAAHAESAAGAIVWHTAMRLLRGESLHDVMWDEAGHLALSFLAPDGAAERVLLAGLNRAGLDDASATRVAVTARAFASRDVARLVRTEAAGHATVGAFLAHDSRTDLAAELLRRGLARLDLGDRATLQQQPTLIRAALAALLDPSTRSQRAIADAAYQRGVTALATELGVSP
jgi:hypothetical protein